MKFSIFNFQFSINNNGFLLIELLVVIGILIILAAIIPPTLRSFEKELDLNNSTEQIINILRLARNKTLASEKNSQWGVFFDNTTVPHQYVLFKGNNYASRDNPFDKIYKLPERVEIYQIDLVGGGKEIIFERVIGTTEQSGQIVLRLKTDFSKTKTIYIENSGKIELTESSVLDDENRIKDSRHIHFDLGWSIQNSDTLKFKFLGLESDQIETKTMANYFNSDKTEFDWSNQNEPFIVDGSNQVFHIHTHSLDSFNTILCIHRDRNKEENNKEVIIYIIDGEIEKDIVHYLADTDDNIGKGAYVYNEMERQ